MTVSVEHCLLMVHFWTTYAFSRSAFVCQALSLIIVAVFPFFLWHVWLLHTFPWGAVVQLPKSMMHESCPFFHRWFCDRSRGLFKKASNAHLSQLCTPGLTSLRPFILARQTCNPFNQDALIKWGQAALSQLSWISLFYFGATPLRAVFQSQSAPDHTGYWKKKVTEIKQFKYHFKRTHHTCDSFVATFLTGFFNRHKCPTVGKKGQNLKSWDAVWGNAAHDTHRKRQSKNWPHICWRGAKNIH